MARSLGCSPGAPGGGPGAQWAALIPLPGALLAGGAAAFAAVAVLASFPNYLLPGIESPVHHLSVGWIRTGLGLVTANETQSLPPSA